MRERERLTLNNNWHFQGNLIHSIVLSITFTQLQNCLRNSLLDIVIQIPYRHFTFSVTQMTLYLCMAPSPNFLSVSQLILSVLEPLPSTQLTNPEILGEPWLLLPFTFTFYKTTRLVALSSLPWLSTFPNWFPASSYFIPPGLILHMAAGRNLPTSLVWSVHDEYNILMLLMSILLLFNGYGVSLISCLYYWLPFLFLFSWGRMAYWLQTGNRNCMNPAWPVILLVFGSRWLQMCSHKGSPWILWFYLQAPRASCPARPLAGWVRTFGSRVHGELSFLALHVKPSASSADIYLHFLFFFCLKQ